MTAEDKRQAGEQGSHEKNERRPEREGAQMDDGPVRSGHDLPDTGQGQGQSKGKPQIQPQE
jgi:hypothetical protein